MLKEGIEKIISMAIPGEVIEAEDQKFWAKGEVFKLINPKDVKTLSVRNLDALFDYIQLPEVKDYKPFVFISDHQRVVLKTLLDKSKDRENLFEIFYDSFNFESNRYHPLEDFLVRVQSNFVNDLNLIELMKFLSGIADVSEMQVDDNGVTQTVKVKTGIVKVGETSIKNPVVLSPCITFSQIDQPAINYILRLKKNGGEILVALFDETSPAWKVSTIQKIKEYIQMNLPESHKSTPVIG